jgi:hypothetical protein
MALVTFLLFFAFWTPLAGEAELFSRDPVGTGRKSSGGATCASPILSHPPAAVDAHLTHSVRVFDYQHRTFPTSIDLRGTALLPEAHGTVGLVGKVGNLDANAAFMGMLPASQFGAEYLTYVLWAITAEGRPVNIAEISVQSTGARLVAPSGKSKVTTDLKAFGLVVTAEPYFAVTTPSDVVIMENEAKPEADGRPEDSEAKYEVLPKGYYRMTASPQEVLPAAADLLVTLEILEARNAVQIARWVGADRYAPETLKVAMLLLSQAEVEQGNKNPDLKRAMKAAREAAEIAEDARAFALKRKSQ